MKHVDTGDILLQKRVKIHEDDNMLSLGMRLCATGANMLLETMKSFKIFL